MLRGAALRHKQQFIALLAEGAEITIAAADLRVASTTPVDKVLGRRPAPTATPTGPLYTVQALVSSGYTGLDYQYGAIPAAIATIGRSEPGLVIVRTLLDDVLVNIDAPYGDTFFHGARSVTIGNETFSVAGVDRSGLAPLPPYIAWVGLRRTGAV